MVFYPTLTVTTGQTWLTHAPPTPFFLRYYIRMLMLQTTGDEELVSAATGQPMWPSLAQDQPSPIQAPRYVPSRQQVYRFAHQNKYSRGHFSLSLCFFARSTTSVPRVRCPAAMDALLRDACSHPTTNAFHPWTCLLFKMSLHRRGLLENRDASGLPVVRAGGNRAFRRRTYFNVFLVVHTRITRQMCTVVLLSPSAALARRERTGTIERRTCWRVPTPATTPRKEDGEGPRRRLFRWQRPLSAPSRRREWRRTAAGTKVTLGRVRRG